MIKDFLKIYGLKHIGLFALVLASIDIAFSIANLIGAFSLGVISISWLYIVRSDCKRFKQNQESETANG